MNLIIERFCIGVIKSRVSDMASSKIVLTWPLKSADSLSCKEEYESLSSQFCLMSIATTSFYDSSKQKLLNFFSWRKQ